MVRLLPLALLLALAPAAHAESLTPGQTTVLDRPDGLGALPFDGQNTARIGSGHVISADGRFVVFSSTADALSPDDNDAVSNVYRWDRQTKATTLVASGNAGSLNPIISADGSKVLFASSATNLTPDATSGVTELFVKDMTTNSTTLVSRSTGQAGAADPSGVLGGEYDISGDGTMIAWQTRGQLKVTGMTDANQETDTYARSLTGNTTYLVSHTKNGTVAVGGSGPNGDAPTLGYFGGVVAFATTANLTGPDGDSAPDVYLVATDDPHYEVLMSPDQPGVSGPAAQPDLDPSGTLVAYVKGGQIYGGNDMNVFPISAADGNGTISGVPADQPLWAASADAGLGEYVSFRAAGATALDPHGTATVAKTLYVRDVNTQTTRRVSGNPELGSDVISGSISARADAYAYTINPGSGLPGADSVTAIYTGRPGAGDAQRVGAVGALGAGSATQSATGRRISADGSRSVFAYSGPALTADPIGTVKALYLRDAKANTTTLVSVGQHGAAPNASTTDAQLSADGTKVAFMSVASNLVDGDSNGFGDVFVRDLTTGQTTAVDTDSAGHTVTGGAAAPAISGDGTKVAFVSTSNELPDNNGSPRIYIKDLASGKLTDVTAVKPVAEPALNADGSKLAFSTTAALTAADTNGLADVYLRDLTAGTTSLISKNGGVTPELADDGGRVFYLSAGGLWANGTLLADHVADYDAAADGATIAYVASDGHSYAGAADGSPAGRLLGDGEHADTVALSGDGACAAIGGTGLPGYPSRDFTHVVLRARTAACLPAPATTDPTPTPEPTCGADCRHDPIVTPTPTPTPTHTDPKPPKITSTVSLPSATRCISKRQITLTVRAIKGAKISRLDLYVGKQRVKRLRNAKAKQTVTLKGLPKGSYTVKVTALLSDGRRITDARRYKTCIAKRR